MASYYCRELGISEGTGFSPSQLQSRKPVVIRVVSLYTCRFLNTHEMSLIPAVILILTHSDPNAEGKRSRTRVCIMHVCTCTTYVPVLRMLGQAPNL